MKAAEKVTGPRGGKGTVTEYKAKDGQPIIQRESGGYYYVDKNGKQVSVNSPKPHGNTLNSEKTEIYIKRDAQGNYEKTGISKKSSERYSDAEIDGGSVDVIGTRPRDRAAKLERYMVEKKPGPQNKEPWAGKRDPSHPNYDPNYIPAHMRKK